MTGRFDVSRKSPLVCAGIFKYGVISLDSPVFVLTVTPSGYPSTHFNLSMASWKSYIVSMDFSKYGPRYYILQGRECIPCNLMEWGKWFEENRETRIVKRTDVNGISVSTVFLGLDHNYLMGDDALPLLFETMTFDGKDDVDQICERYTTYEEAERGHDAVVEALKEKA